MKKNTIFSYNKIKKKQIGIIMNFDFNNQFIKATRIRSIF